MRFNTGNRILTISLVSLIFVISSLSLIRNIYDPDFFWHLKTGEWIWQHRSLPSEDPFAYTSAGHQTTREHFILTSFWLGQVTYHLFYLAGRLSGIAFMRFLIVGALLLTFWKARSGDNIIYLGLIIIVLTFFLDQYPIERPQVFSFLFFAVLLNLLERIRGKEDGRGAPQRSEYLLIPVLMLFWANMHPGVILGHGVIILYVAMEGAKFLHPSLRPIEMRAYKKLCLTSALGILFSLVNPNTFLVWREYWEYSVPVDHWNLTPAYLSSVNPEYMSSIQFFVMYNNYTEALYWLILALAIAGQALNWKKTDITELALITATGVFSFFTTRYAFFFMVAALPVVARHFSKEGVIKFSRAAVAAIAIFAGVFFSWGERSNIKNLTEGVRVDDHLYPVKAANFIISHDLRGNMYNVYEWGGYLIWRLAPERQVFTDPRDLFKDIGVESALLNDAYTRQIAGMPAWKSIVQARGIEYMVIPVAWETGPLLPLFSALIRDNDWRPVFCDTDAVIFVRDSPVNEGVIRKYSVPKDLLLNSLTVMYNRLVTVYSHRQKASLYITMGDLYLSMGDKDNALNSYEKASEIAPLNIIARERLNNPTQKNLRD